jgi:hypothetical protein
VSSQLAGLLAGLKNLHLGKDDSNGESSGEEKEDSLLSDGDDAAHEFGWAAPGGGKPKAKDSAKKKASAKSAAKA